jgi:hypothetical protein
MNASSTTRPSLGDVVTQLSSSSSPRAHRFDLFSAQNSTLLESAVQHTSHGASSRNVPRLQSPLAFGGSALSALDGLESGFGVRRRAELLDPSVVVSPATYNTAVRSPGAFDRAQWIMAAERYKTGLMSPTRAQQVVTAASPVIRIGSASRMDLATQHSVGGGLPADSDAHSCRLDVAPDLRAQVTPHRRPIAVLSGPAAPPTHEKKLHEGQPAVADERIYQNPRVKAWRVYKAVLKIILEDMSRNHNRTYKYSFLVRTHLSCFRALLIYRQHRAFSHEGIS